MAKISELPPITGANTRPEDLFVIVNLVQGDDGTSNITRKELVEAIQYEIFSRINITGGTISGVVMSDSRLNNVEIDNSEIEDTDFIRGSIDDTVITNSTANNITMTYSSFQFGTLLDSTANNITITQSDFSQGTGNNNVFTNTTLLDGSANNFVITDSTANNIIITNSELNDSTANNVAITDSTVNNTIITSSEFNDGTANNVAITQSDFSDGTINDTVIETSEFNNGTMDTVTGINLDISNSAYANGTVSDSILTDNTILNGTANNIAITDSTANNTIITNSEFNDGTGNNVTLTNSTIDDSLFSDGTISNTSFTGTMDSVIATNMQIRSSTADGLGANNSTFENGGISQSTFSGGVIDKSSLVDFDMEINKEFEAPMDDESYFAIRNEKTGSTEQINFGQLFDEVSKKTAQALKVHVDAGSGNDDNPGTQLQPVRTLEKAFELCLEKAGGELNRNAINNSVHISVGPGTYYTKGNLQLPDDCSITSTSGQYATVIELEKGYENNNGILVGSGCYAQGFAYQNFQVDNFDFPEGGFAIAYRPGAKLLRSPYLRDSSQLSNFLRADVEPPLNPYNSKGTLADLGREFTLTSISDPTKFAIDDEIIFSSGAIGYVSYISEIASDSKIHVRNLKNNQGFAVGDTITAESGGTAVIQEIGIDDFPNREVGRGGGCVLADRRVLDTDSLYTYVLCFGFTPRSQNGIGYVARDGAGVNGIGSLSIFVRCAFYALNGGQMTLNNSGTQFGDISMRAKGTTNFFAPKSTTATIIGNTAFADTIDSNKDDIIDDMVGYLTANTANGGLGYKQYDSEKCLRDAGIVLDGTGYDVALDTNYWGRLAGITYRSPISYVVPGEQLEETKGALEYLRDRTKEVFVNANSEINTRIETSFAELLNVLEYGEENMNGIVWQDTSVPRTAARTLIQDNKSFIADELIDWIENNDEFYAYDSAKCRRDVQDYILPAVSNDMQFDTNYNAVTAGRAYYMATAAKVVQQQNNETVAAYKRLKDQVNELIDGDSYLASEKLDEGFEEIITILENSGTQFTPTAATYDPSTGLSVITLGAGHGLTKGRKVLLKQSGLIFTCDRDNNTTRHAYPRASDPANGSPIEVIGVTDTKIVVNVGKSDLIDTHTFVEALPNAVSILGSAITWSDSSSIPADKRSARQQLQSNREFLQELVLGYIDENYFRYNSDKCKRDIEDYIVPAVERDILTGTNYNAIQTGIAYRAGTTLTDNVINDQLVETTGAINNLKSQVLATITDNASDHRAAVSFDKMVGILNSANKTYSTTTANYDPASGLTTITIGSHDLQPGDEVIIAPDSMTFTCASDGNATQHTYPTTTITSFTPTNATYDPSTGIFTATIGTHKLQAGDFIEIAQDSIVFTCDSDSNVTELSAPQPHHPFYKKKIALTSVTGTTITCNVGIGSGGVHTFVSAVTGAITGERQHPAYKKPVVVAAVTPTTFTVNVGPSSDVSVHTFVSATANNIKTAKYISAYTPTNATYDPATGDFVATIGQHNLVAGDYVEIKPESVVFTCAQDGNATEHAYPESHHPAYKTPVRILSVTSDTISMNVGIGAGGVHTFVRANVGAIDSDALVFTDPASHVKHYTPTTATYDPVTGISVVTIPGHDLTTSDWIQFAPYSFTFTCSLDSDATEHSYPRKGDGNYNMPMAITNVAGDDITVNVGTGSGGAHTFVSVTTDAVTKLSYNSQGQYAREQLQINKDFLAAEVNAYLDDNYFIFDGEKCSRDTGLILDAVRRDVASGSNYHAVFNGLSYRLGGAGAQLVVNEQLTETVAAINFLKTKAAAQAAVTGTALTRSDAAFAEIIDILQNTETAADTLTFGTNSVSANHTIARQILQLNKSFLQAEVTAYIAQTFPSLTYDVAKCERDTGYLTDAISWDIQHGSNAAAVNFARMYYDNAIAVLPEEQILPTAKTWEHIANVAYDIVRNIAVTPTTGNAVSQNQTLSDAGVEVGESVRSGINITTQVIRDKNRDHLPAYVEPIVESGMESAVNVLDGITENLQEAVIDYLRQEHNGLPYSKAKCTRDVGLIVDAVSRDIEYGGNENTVEIFEYYFKRFQGESADYEQLRSTNVLPIEVKGQFKTLSDYNDTANVSGLRESISILPYEQRIPTKLAFAHLADVAEKIVKEVAHTPTTGNSLTQDTTGTPADATTGTSVHDLINTIAELVDNVNIEDAEMPTVVKASFDPNRTLARKQLQRNRQFIIEEVDGYIKDRWFAFDGDKCKRDIGLILDAVANDVLTGSNFNAVFNGLAYRIGTVGADAVVNEQLSETVKAVEYARDITVAAVTDATMKQRTLDSFNEIIDIMTNGSGNADVIDYTSVSPSFNRLNARNQLQNNKAFLQAEITAWLAVNRPSLTYDVAKCERDLGYLIDAVSFDAQFGGNFATINDAKLYFENAVSVLPVDQRQPTADAFAHIGDCAELICLDTDIGGLKSVGNALTQDITAGSAGAATAAEVEGLFDIVAGSIENNTLLMNPIQVGPDVTAYNATNSNAVSEILGVKETVQGGVISHLSKFFEILPYNETKCRRDIGYIVDAISHDIQYGGNAATVNTVNMYFTNGINTGLPIEQRQKTKDAYLHMSKIIEHVVGGKSITTTEFPRTGKFYTGDILTKYEYWNGMDSYQTTESQDFAVHGANPDTCIAARQLAEIIANGVDDATEVRNTIPERIDIQQTWMGTNYITSKELVERQADNYSEGVINYLSTTFNGLSFPEAKCRRDVGYLIDAVSHDVQHDTNYATRIAAQIYFENGLSVLPADTRTQTADIYQFLGDAVEQVVQEIPVTNASTYTLLQQDVSGTAATAAEGTTVHDLIGYVEASIRDNDLDKLPALSSTATWPAAELSAAVITIDDNSEELASDVTEFINNNFNVLDYNKAKCRRDTGYLLDAFSFDLNYGGNTASRWNADFYFWNQIYRLPEDQRIPTARSYRQLGRICKDIVIGEYPKQKILGELGTEIESKKVEKLANIFYNTQLYNDTKYLPVKEEPDYTYSVATFTDALNVIEQRKKNLQKDTVRFVNATYDFIDINLTRRDASNLLTAVMNDFKYEDLQVPAPSYTTNGNQNAVRTFTSSLFNYDGTHVFPVFNAPIQGLKYKGSVNDVADLGSLTGMKPNWAYIVATDYSTNFYAGDIYYWNGIQFVNAGPNNTDLLDAFTGSWDRMRTYLVNNLSPDGDHSAMIEGLFNECLKDNVLRPNTLVFGSLVESIAHQFNGASAGVNRNALPLNFRNLGSAISAIASVLNEDGGRIRWSGADELNNQYFARGLRINGRTGRIEGRPFTSSVRKLARRASNSRAVV